jgi:hypothetical protein
MLAALNLSQHILPIPGVAKAKAMKMKKINGRQPQKMENIKTT